MRGKGRAALLECDDILGLEGLVAFSAPAAIFAADTELHDALLAHHVSTALDGCYLLVHKGLLAAPAHVLMKLVLV